MDETITAGRILMTEPVSRPAFCSQCGTKLLPDSKFCHACGASTDGGQVRQDSVPSLSPAMRWAIPGAAILILLVVVFFKLGAKEAAPDSTAAAPFAAGSTGAPPDISSMSPEEQASRLFNRVMTYWSEGKKDSAAFFAPMASTAIESLQPLTAHSRYDLGLVALVAGDAGKAVAESDTILKARPTHLLGLLLAARAADARGDAAAAKAAREKMLASEKSERASGLQEYTDHDADLREAIAEARR